MVEACWLTTSLLLVTGCVDPIKFVETLMDSEFS